MPAQTIKSWSNTYERHGSSQLELIPSPNRDRLAAGLDPFIVATAAADAGAMLRRFGTEALQL
jgi:hypothetical protein